MEMKDLTAAIEQTEKKLDALVDPLIKRIEAIEKDPNATELKNELKQYQLDNKKPLMNC